MSIISNLMSKVTSLLGLQPKVPAMPKPVVPAAPAPTARNNTGATVNIGSQSGNTRISGGGATQIGQQVDVLGTLGLGGLHI